MTIQCSHSALRDRLIDDSFAVRSFVRSFVRLFVRSSLTVTHCHSLSLTECVDAEPVVRLRLRCRRRSSFVVRLFLSLLSLLRCFVASLLRCFVASLLRCFVASLLRSFVALLFRSFVVVRSFVVGWRSLLVVSSASSVARHDSSSFVVVRRRSSSFVRRSFVVRSSFVRRSFVVRFVVSFVVRLLVSSSPRLLVSSSPRLLSSLVVAHGLVGAEPAIENACHRAANCLSLWHRRHVGIAVAIVVATTALVSLHQRV